MESEIVKKANRIVLLDEIFDYLIERVDDVIGIYTENGMNSLEPTEIKITLKPKTRRGNDHDS